ncbi:MAG: hypothetical protein NZU63_06395 [Gemmataceae bacterium]|nr:hypothetical protein [Gemmataceae bacterium]MDW8242602.1 hypothetical protein [Thermogemmata sp.]
MARKRGKVDDYHSRVQELCSDAFELDHGHAQIALLQEAVQIADAHGDAELGYEVRHHLIDAATFGGAPEVALVAFAWCLARSDEDPQRFDPDDLYWKYKWMATAAVKFPTISQQQLTQLLEDMRQRYIAAGIGLHPFYQTRRSVYLTMGEIQAAWQDHEQVLKLEPNWMSDCPACERDSTVDVYLELGDYQQAVATAQPIFAGKMRCMEVPHRTYAKFLLSLLQRQETERASAYHRQGLRLIRTQPAFIQEAALHLLFLTLTNNLAAATRLAQRYLPLYLACRCPLWRFEFSRVMAFVCQRLAQSEPPLRLRLPEHFPLPEGVDRKDYSSLAMLFRTEAQELATAFDIRNGNDHYRKRFAQLDLWPQQIQPLPM